MDLQTLLANYVEQDKIGQLLGEMKSNKIFTASEENLDTRYSKLKTDYDGLATKNDEANSLIEQLKTSNAGNEDLQNQIGTYETKLAELEAENEALKLDNAIKVELLANKAKADDLEYLMFKIKQNNAELSLDEKGKVKGFDNVLEEIKTSCSSNFEVESKKKVDVNNLPNLDGQEKGISKEDFNKMSYKEKNQLYLDDPETYKKLSNN